MRKTRKRSRTPAPERLDREPIVVIRGDVLNAIAEAARASVDAETAGALIGTVETSWEPDGSRPIVSVLGVVPPGPGLRAGPASVAIGSGGDGERASSALRWWRAVTGFDLRHVGDWHKHPSGYPEASPGDRATARAMRRKTGADPWLTVVVAGDRGTTADLTVEGSRVAMTRLENSREEARFYRAADPDGLIEVPVRVEDAATPRLPDLPWHVADPVRFGAECRLLHAAGFEIGLEPIVSDGRAGIAIRLFRDNDQIGFVTGARYPTEAPTPIHPPADDAAWWTESRFLVDLANGAR